MIDAAEKLARSVGVAPACRALGVPRSSLYRHRRPAPVKPPRPAHRPPRALTDSERERVLAVLHEERFADRAPTAVYATLLEEGAYLCSIRTMYRILKAAGEVRERRAQRRHPRREPPRLVATAPNQVWTWDITRLPGPRKWTSYALYVVLDLFSRYVVAWMLAEQETAKLAKRLVREACAKQGIVPGQLILHQDRGAPMTAKTFSQLLVDLDILASYSRPRVSDDNPHSESCFKTVKYAASYPGWFAGPEAERTWCGPFFDFYNTEHRHSGLGLLTPDAVHHGRAGELQAARQRVLADAYAMRPERFVNGAPRAPEIPSEVWIKLGLARANTDNAPEMGKKFGSDGLSEKQMDVEERIDEWWPCLKEDAADATPASVKKCLCSTGEGEPAWKPTFYHLKDEEIPDYNTGRDSEGTPSKNSLFFTPHATDAQLKACQLCMGVGDIVFCDVFPDTWGKPEAVAVWVHETWHFTQYDYLGENDFWQITYEDLECIPDGAEKEKVLDLIALANCMRSSLTEMEAHKKDIEYACRNSMDNFARFSKWSFYRYYVNLNGDGTNDGCKQKYDDACSAFESDPPENDKAKKVVEKLCGASDAMAEKLKPLKEFFEDKVEPCFDDSLDSVPPAPEVPTC